MKQLVILAVIVSTTLAQPSQRFRRDASSKAESQSQPTSQVYYKQQIPSNSQYRPSSTSQPQNGPYVPPGYPEPKKTLSKPPPANYHSDSGSYYESNVFDQPPSKRDIRPPPHSYGRPHHHQHKPSYGYQPEPHYGGHHYDDFTSYTDLQEELLYLKEEQRRLKQRQLALQEKALRQLEAATEALRLAEHAVREEEEEELEEEQPVVQIVPRQQPQFQLVAVNQATNTLTGTTTGIATGGGGGLLGGALGNAVAAGQNVQLTLANGQTITLPASALQTATLN